jgi:GNAT superfamily N-acetyltransferase
MHTIKPLDKEAVCAAANECGAIITVEEHMLHGGLGEACAAVLMERGVSVPFRIVGIPDEYTVTGSQSDIYRHYGISMEGLSSVAIELVAAPSLVIRRADMSSPLAQRLIIDLNAELSRRYPEEGANHFQLDEHEVANGTGAFLVAYRRDVPIGCGAVRRLDATTAEIKRMYVRPSARGKGVGRAVLAELEQEARRLGARRLVLETGVRQPDAIAVYRQAGFTEVPLFGEYAQSPCPELSICMAKDL